MGKTTDTKYKILAFIIEYKRAHDGCSPTCRVIADSIDGTKSKSTVSYNLQKLSDLGLIRLPEPKGKCGIQVVGGRWEILPSVDARQQMASCQPS